MTSVKSSKAFLDAVENRRTYYQISAKSPISDEAILAIIERSVMHVPSVFNCQAGRAILLLGNASKRAWECVKKEFLPILDKDDEAYRKKQSEKIDEYAAGYGSVVVLEDQKIIQAMNEKMPFYKESNSFEIWSENSTGMLQYTIWTALEAEGFGASLQHHASFHSKIDAALKQELDLPTSWKCTAIIPFGVPTDGPGYAGKPKTFEPIEKRVKVLRD